MKPIKILRKKTIKIVLFSLMALLVLQKCSFSNSKKVTVLQQNLIFDSISKKSDKFEVNLHTTLEFNIESIQKEDYENFFIIIDLDTFPLIVKQKSIKKDKDEKFRIKYFSPLKFESNVFENDSLKKIILNQSKIIKNKKIVERAYNYYYQSLITLPNRSKDRFDM